MGVYFLDELHLTIGYFLHGNYLTINEVRDLRPRGGSILEVNITTNEIVKQDVVDLDLFSTTIKPLLIFMFRPPFKLRTAHYSQMLFFDSVFL